MLVNENSNRELWRQLINDEDIHAELSVIDRRQVVHLARFHCRGVEEITFVGSPLNWAEIQEQAKVRTRLHQGKGDKPDDFIVFRHDDLKAGSPQVRRRRLY